MENRKMVFVQCSHIGKRDKATSIFPSPPLGAPWSKIGEWFNRRVKDMYIRAVLVKVWSPLLPLLSHHCLGFRLTLLGVLPRTIPTLPVSRMSSSLPAPVQQHNEGVLCLQPQMSALCSSEVGFCEKLDNLRNKKLLASVSEEPKSISANGYLVNIDGFPIFV